MPVGSELSRRAMRLPVGPQAPQKIQQPDCRAAVVAQFGEARELLARLARDLGRVLRVRQVLERLAGVLLGELFGRRALGLRVVPGQVQDRVGIRAAVLGLVHRAHPRESSGHDLADRVRASPGGSAPFQCHCSQRAELTSEPFSSAKQVVGRRNTSVWILLGSTSLCSP